MKKIFKLTIFILCTTLLHCQCLLGSRCISCSDCKMPEIGPPGLPGPEGPQGPQGNISLESYLSLSLESPVAVPVLSTEPVIFNLVNAITTDNFSYDAGTGTITINNVGCYCLKFGFSTAPGDSNRQFILKLNGLYIPGSALDSQAGQMQGLTIVLITKEPMSTLELVNISALTTSLEASPNSGQSAYIVIDQAG